MSIKHSFFNLIFFISILSAIVVLSGCNKYVTLTSTGDRFPSWNSKRYMNKLQKSVTHFIYTGQMYADSAAFQAAVKKVWTYTPIDFITFKQAQQYYNKPGHSFLWLGGEIMYNPGGFQIMTAMKTPLDFARLYLVLSLPETNLFGSDASMNFLRIELSATERSMSRMIDSHKKNNGPIDDIFETAEFYNLSPTMLSLYLLEAQKQLATGWCEGPRYSMRNEDEMKLMANKTLYVPEAVFFMKDSNFQSPPDEASVKELMQYYPYQYKVVSEKELAEIISASEEPVYIFDCVVSYNVRAISFFNSKTGLVYRMAHSAFNTAKHKTNPKDLYKIF